MPRVLTPAIVLALMLGFAGSALAQPFVVVYASDATPACDLSGAIEANPTVQPTLPPVDIPIGQSKTLDLCFIVLPIADSTSGQIACTNGTGTESCAEQAQLTTNGGIEITGFTRCGGDPCIDIPPGEANGSFPKYEARFTATSLKIAGGHPITGRQASGLQGLRWGTVTLQGVAPAGIFELTSVGGYLGASMQKVTYAATVLATSINLCGNSVLDAGEQCEDGNQDNGDGCAATCRIETYVDLLGAVSPTSLGNLTIGINDVVLTLDFTTLPGAPADEVVQALVAAVDDEPSLDIIHLQVDDPNQPEIDDGRRFLTDGTITTAVTISSTAGDTLEVPEPGRFVMLVSGIALLLGLARLRRRESEPLTR